MAYLGNEPGLTNYIVVVEKFSGTGACTQFTLSRTDVQDPNSIDVRVNSVPQDPTDSYSVANGVITFTEAPSSNANNIVVTYRNTAVITYGNINGSQISDGTITLEKFAAGTVQNYGTYANSGFAVANSAALYANSAFLKANTPDHVANSASSYANAGFAVANSAASYANAAFGIANTATTVGTYANAAFAVANSGSTYANTAFSTANGRVNTANTNTFTANQTFTVANVTNQLAVFGYAYQNIRTLTDATTITANLAQTNNFVVTLGGNRTMANATNITAGQSGFVVVRQDGTGSRTLTFGTGWRFPGNTAPTLTTTASAVDLIVYTARDSGNLVAQAILNVT